MFLRHPILSLITLVYLGLVGWLTLTPQASIQRDSMLWHFAQWLNMVLGSDWFSYDRLEFVANVAMFIPVGLFFLLLFGRARWWLAILIAVALTLGIEFVQQFIPTRVSDPRDLVSNSVGALVGALLALVLTAGKARRLRRAASVPKPRVS